MKKRIGFVIGFLVLFMMPFVSAELADRVQGVVTNAIDIVQKLASPIFESILGTYSTGDFFFARILVLALLIIMITFVLRKTPQFKTKKGFTLIIAIIISVLGVRFMSENDFFSAILIPTGVLAISVMVGFMTLLFFYFVHHTELGSAGRRLAWGFYGIVFAVLWWQRSDSISTEANWIFAGAAAFVILSLLFDRRVRVYFMLREIKGAERSISDSTILHLLDELEKAEKFSYTPAGKRKADEIKIRLKELGVKGLGD